MALSIQEDSPRLLTVREVAKILRLSVGSVRSLILKQEIPALRFGKQFRIPKHVIDNLFSPLLGETPEAMGFGLWKGRKETSNSMKYVQQIRRREESKSLDEILEELHAWEKASSSTPIS